MTTPLKVTPKELRQVAAYLTQHGPCTSLAVANGTGIPTKRCAVALKVVGEIGRIASDGKARYVHWAIRPDHEARIALNPARVKMPTVQRAHPQTRYRDPEGDTYPTADPHHFDVDWLGHIIYTGPR